MVVLDGFIIAEQFEELHACSEGGFNVLVEDGFVGVMADAAGAAEEEHGGGEIFGDDHGVVACAAGHDA